MVTRRYWEFVRSDRFFGLVEQAMLSVTNFLVVLLAARRLSKEEWGIYSLGYAILIFAQGFQRALVVLPMISFARTPELLFHDGQFWFKAQLMLTAVVLAFLVAMLLVASGVGPTWLSEAIGVSAILSPFVFSHEFLRRWLIQEGKLASLLPMAFVYSLVCSVGLLLALGFARDAWVVAAVVALGAALAAAFGAFKVTAPTSSGPPFIGRLREIRHFGFWSSLSHIAFSMYNSAVQAILASFSGPAAVGVFSATRTLVQPVQVLILAVDAVDKPRASAAFARDGLGGMVVSLRKTSRTLVTLGCVYLAAAALLGSDLLHVFFGGKYDSYVSERWLWIAVSFLMLLAQPLESGLYVLQKPQLLMRGRVVGALSGIAIAVAMTPRYGAAGALMAVLAGWASSALITKLQLRKLAREMA